jgi:hypothetical protein
MAARRKDPGLKRNNDQNNSSCGIKLAALVIKFAIRAGCVPDAQPDRAQTRAKVLQ